jgi:ubiquinone/menaquinone biosynthesis C-methylase UbiE
MPEEQLWATFFDPPTILAKLGLTSACLDAAEVGCGYGTFTIPASRVISGTLHALDIDPEMIEATR